MVFFFLILLFFIIVVLGLSGTEGRPSTVQYKINKIKYQLLHTNPLHSAES